MQADWATVGRGADKLSLFIATLGWSRQAYVEFCDDERVETLIGCHDCVPDLWGRAVEVLYDNMKTVVMSGTLMIARRRARSTSWLSEARFGFRLLPRCDGWPEPGTRIAVRGFARSRTRVHATTNAVPPAARDRAAALRFRALSRPFGAHL